MTNLEAKTFLVSPAAAMNPYLALHHGEAPPVQRYGLFWAAVVMALLGLTTADVAETQAARSQVAGHDERSAEFIIASAVFAGVQTVPQAPMP